MTNDQPPTTNFNPFDPAFRADPYPTYAYLREHAPVMLGSMNTWAVSRYDDVCHVLKSPHIFSSAGMGGASMGAGVPVRSIITSDPPDHTYIRNLVNRAFTPRMVAGLEPRIREITRDLLARALPAGKFDLVQDLAVPLPVTIIAEILGVDPERRADFKRWSNAIVGTSPSAAAEPGVPRLDSDVGAFRAFFAAAVEDRRREPKDDLISALVRTQPDDERALNTAEIVAFAQLLLVAGNETTTNLISNAMLALLDHPDQLERVRSEPSLIPNMVEEALRYDAPVQFLFRSTKQDTEIAGTKVPAGQIVIPIYASANRDDRRYPDAGRFDVTRNAQGHLAFGLGPHFCLGAPLARLEAKVAFEELLASTTRIELAGEPVRINSLFLRGLHHLPLAARSS